MSFWNAIVMERGLQLHHTYRGYVSGSAGYEGGRLALDDLRLDRRRLLLIVLGLHVRLYGFLQLCA